MNRDLPPLNALRAFEATARLNSVSQAAEQLHVTHGAVSRQLKVLEEHLGVSLFVKEGRGLKLTDSGIRLRDASFGMSAQNSRKAVRMHRLFSVVQEACWLVGSFPDWGA